MPNSWIKNAPLKRLNETKLNLLKKGEKLHDFSMINPLESPSRIMLDRLVESSMTYGSNRYAVSRGIRKLRESFSSLYEESFQVDLSPEENICVTMGSKDAILHTLMSNTVEGQTVLLPKPTYPAYLSALKLSGLKAEFFEVSSNEKTMISEIESITSSKSISAIILNFPHNPTGITVTGDFYKKIAKLVENEKLFIMNDFVYGQMGYKFRNQPSLISAGLEGLVEVYSMSKAYNIPGWRIGAMSGDAQIVKNLSQLKSNIDYGSYLPLQNAAAAGLNANRLCTESTVARYSSRSESLSKVLKSICWTPQDSSAGCCLWVKVPNWYNYPQNESLAEKLLRETGIATTPGTFFGEEYTNYLRFALVVAEEEYQDVHQKLVKFDSQFERPRVSVA